MTHKRNRYQLGSLTIETRKNGPDVHVIRWREAGPDGSETRKKHMLGTVSELPTKASVKKAAEAIRVQINNGPQAFNGITFASLTEHYLTTELVNIEARTARTREVYTQHIKQCILPKWGAWLLSAIRAVDVEAWLASLPGAPGTKAKTKVVMSGIFQHAHRYGWVSTNPMRSVRQSMTPVKTPDVLTAGEITALLAELPEPFRTIVHLAATTGLRRGEVFGLKWEDVDLDGAEIRIVRSLVDQVAGEPKTPGSKRPLPLPSELIQPLTRWRDRTEYGRPSDWVFASPTAMGEHPYWPNTVLVRHIKPAALRAGIRKRLGWHTFRHTFATLLQREVHDPKVTQSLMRHASPVVTLGRYSQAIDDDKRVAQSLVSALFSPQPQQAIA